jgi:hypothetical protein
MFQIKLHKKTKARILYSITFQKIVQFFDYVAKYGTAGQDTDDNIIQLMRFACWMSKASRTDPQNM